MQTYTKNHKQQQRQRFPKNSIEFISFIILLVYFELLFVIAEKQFGNFGKIKQHLCLFCVMLPSTSKMNPFFIRFISQSRNSIALWNSIWSKHLGCHTNIYVYLPLWHVLILYFCWLLLRIEMLEIRKQNRTLSIPWLPKLNDVAVDTEVAHSLRRIDYSYDRWSKFTYVFLKMEFD